MTDRRLDGAAGSCMSLALREALSAGSNFITPEHLLLGIIRHDDKVVTTVLQRLEREREHHGPITITVSGTPDASAVARRIRQELKRAHVSRRRRAVAWLGRLLLG